MTTPAFVDFIDITEANFNRAPLVKGGIRAVYATGSSNIKETAAQLLALKQAGMGVILIDQTPDLILFGAGLADVADIEAFAGTPEEAAIEVAKRQAHTWQSTCYVSFNSLADLKSHIKNPTGVFYGVADYNWSHALSEELLNQNPDWAYTQFGDNLTNAGTLVPGTNVTCGQAGCDIDVAKYSWAKQFIPVTPPPPPLFTWEDEAEVLANGLSVGAVQLRALLLKNVPN